MGKLFSLIRGLVSLVFVLVGVGAVVVLFARLLADSASPDSAGIMIASGAGRSANLSTAEARTIYATLQARADEINTPLSSDPSLVPFTIQTGEDALSVAGKLQTIGLINDAHLFVQLLRFNGLDTRLQRGDYQLRRNMSMREIGAALYRGRSARLTVTIPPGWRMEQLAEFLTEAVIMDGNLFLRQARQGTVVNHPLLVDRPTGQSYEGYLFPGTYTVTDNATPADLIRQMLDNMAAQLPANAISLARQQGLTFHQALTLASIIEREAVRTEERSLIASVFLNRLKPESAAPHLQADPTIQYALGYQWTSGQWWKTALDLEDYTSVDSPYNTYLYPGLPPGPIASPGIESIMAVLQPAQTNYLFFVCRNPGCQGGAHVFAATYAEHLQNARNYWGE
jgi:UPF0755 protein